MVNKKMKNKNKSKKKIINLLKSMIEKYGIYLHFIFILLFVTFIRSFNNLLKICGIIWIVGGTFVVGSIISDGLEHIDK